MKAAINNLYGNGVGNSGSSRRDIDTRASIEREVPNPVSDVSADTIPDEVIQGKDQQYLANIVSAKSALNGSYAIYLFVGPFNDTPAAWPTDPNLVGTHVVFASLTGMDGVGSPQSMVEQDTSPVQVGGSMPLTFMLLAQVQSGELASMEQDTVASFLTNNLAWRVGMVGSCHPPISSFTISC